MSGRLLTGLRGWRAIGFWFAALLALLSSVFAGVIFVSAMNPDEIEVRVFLDEAGDHLLDGVVGDGLNPVLANVDVYIFLDDGTTPGIADAADTRIGSNLTTDTNGEVLFTGLDVTQSYWVVVESRTVSPPSGDSGGGSGWVAEQTYGPAASHDAFGGITTAAGPVYGGRDPVGNDDASGAEKADHLALVRPGDPVAEFGFSFNVVTSVESNEEQGSLQQFIQNANDIEGPNTMRFVPSVAANGTIGGASYWIVDPDKDEMELNDDETVVDGTAFAPDGTILDPNPGAISPNGGQPVGAGSAVLPVVDRPELSIFDSSFTLRLADGNLPDRSQIRNVHILPHDDKSPPVALRGLAGELIEDVVVDGVVIGTENPVDLTPAPDGNLAAFAVLGDFAPRTVIQNSYLTNTLNDFLSVDNSPDVVIQGNEMLGAGIDGINTAPLSPRMSVIGNHMSDVADYCVDSFSDAAVIRDNTFLQCGDSVGQSGAVRVGDKTATVELNRIEANQGPGVVVAGENIDKVRVAGRALISQNTFSNNDGIAIDLAPASIDNDLNGDGITINDASTTASAGNAFIDYPVIAGVINGSGGSVNITGTACVGCLVEIYTAVGSANDMATPGGVTHGEGTVFLGSGVAVGGTFTIPIDPTGTNDISATATDIAIGATSEFSENFSIDLIAGRVLLDPNGDADISDAAPVPGVTVRIYEDFTTSGGQELPSATDPLVATLTTDAAGGWLFPGATASNYWVTVDSKTIAPQALNAGAAADWAWSEQTYGPRGSLRADGAGGVEATTVAGPAVGGRSGSGSDDASSILTAEHIARVEGSSPAFEIDMAFSFNVVSHTGGGDLTDFDPIGVRTQQGTLRQFIANANAIPGANGMRFVPAIAANAGGGGMQWWRSSITEELPSLNDAGTTVDGQAYDRTAPATVIDPSAGVVLPAITAGTSNIAIAAVDVPELELWGDRSGNANMNGLNLGGANSTVRNLAFLGFRAAVSANNVSAMVLETNAFGFDLGSGADPGASNRLHNGVNFQGGANAVIRSNVFGFSTAASIRPLAGTSNFLIEQNRFVEPGKDTQVNDAVTVSLADKGTIRANHILNATAFGIDIYRTDAGFQIVENTVDGFGSGGLEEGGIRLFGTGSAVERNIFRNGSGSPIVLVGDSSLGPAVVGRPANDVLIRQNEFGVFTDFSGGRAATAVDLVGPDLGEFGTEQGDGPTLNSGTGTGGDCGLEALYGNDGIDYPVIQITRVTAPWVVTGTGCANATVVLYESDSLGGPPTLPVAEIVVGSDGVINSTISVSSTAQFVAAAQFLTRDTSEFAPAVEVTGNQPPVITNPGPQTAIEFDPFSLTVVGSDPDGDPLSWSLGAAPVGMAIDSGTGVITWTPGEADGGTAPDATVTLTAGGQSVSETFTITVTEIDNPPTITNPGPQTATEFVPFTLSMVGNDPDSAGAVWSLNSGPAGLTIDSVTGEIRWTPGEADGGSSPTVSVRLTGGTASTSTSFTITVAEVDNPPVIDDPGPQTATEFVPASFQLTGSDVDSTPLIWALVSGPAGVTVSPTGLVDWTPGETSGGTTQTINVSLTAGGQTVQGALIVDVTEDDQAPVVAPPPPASATTGVLYSATAAGTDPDAPAEVLTWSLAGTVPAGMSIDPVSGLISFTPTTAGPFAVDIVATQPNSLTGQATWTGTVTDPIGPAPVLTPPPAQTISEGQTTTLNFTATNVTSYSLVSGPLRATINPGTGVVTWNATETDGGSIFTFTVEAGGPGGTDQASSTVRVIEDNVAPTIANVPDRTVTVGDRVVVNLGADDADRPRQTLTFSIVSGPAGLVVDNANNRLIWPDAATLGSFPIRVRVSDDGAPSRSADTTFTITVQAPPTTTTTPATTSTTGRPTTTLRPVTTLPPVTTGPSGSTSGTSSTLPATTTTSTSLATTTTLRTTLPPSTPTTAVVPPVDGPDPSDPRPPLPIDEEVLFAAIPDYNRPLSEPYEPTLSLASGIPGLLSAPGSFEIPPTTIGLAGAWILILGIPLVLWERKRAVNVVAGVDADDTLPVYATRNSTYPFAYLRPTASMLWTRYRFFGLGEGLRVKIESPVGGVWVERRHLRPLHETIDARDARDAG